VPKHIRSDNGPEFIAAAIRRWLTNAQVETLYIEPGSPWENGYAESFHSRLRDELLAREEFANLAEARAYGARYRMEYNHRRPHSALGYQTCGGVCRRDQRLEGVGARRLRTFATLSPQPHSRIPQIHPLAVS